MDREQILIFRKALWSLRNSINYICFSQKDDLSDSKPLFDHYSKIRDFEINFLKSSISEKVDIVYSFNDNCLIPIETYDKTHRDSIINQVSNLPKTIRDLIISSKNGNSFPGGFRKRRDILYENLDKLRTDPFNPNNNINAYEILNQVSKFYNPPIQIPENKALEIKKISDVYCNLFNLHAQVSKIRELVDQLKKGISIVAQKQEAIEKEQREKKIQQERINQKKLKEEREKIKLAEQTIGTEKVLENYRKQITELEEKVRKLTKENTELKGMLSQIVRVIEIIPS